MLSSVEATLVGGLLPLCSQYRTERGWHPAARARSACVSPASIRAARIWRPETMLLINKLYIRFWKRRHRSISLCSKAGLAHSERFTEIAAEFVRLNVVGTSRHFAATQHFGHFRS